MTDKYDDNIPLYGSRGIEIYLKLVESKYPEVQIDELLKYAEMESYQVHDEGHLFSQRQINRFYYKLVEMTGNSNIAREAGRFASSPDALPAIRRSVLGLVGPAKYYELLGNYSNKFSKASKYEAVRLGPTKVEITVTPNEGTREEPFQCLNRKGYWDAISGIYNLKPPKIEHPECLFTGGKVCRYIVTWQESKVSTLKSIRNSCAVILGLACIMIPPFIHFSAPGISPWVVMGGLYTFSATFLLFANWFIKRLEMNTLLDTIDTLRTSSDDLMEQIEINYENSLLINEIGQSLAKEPKAEGVFSEIMNILKKRLDYDRALIMLANQGKTRLHFQTGYGYTDEQLEILKKISFHLNNPDSQGIFAVSFQTKKPQLLDDLENIKDSLTPRSYEFARKMGVKSLICCPIIYENEALGILAVDNLKSKKPLLQRDLNLLMGVALQLGSRMHNVKLENYLRQIQKMEAVGNLAGGVAHDFNNILTTILGYSQMLTLQIPSDDPKWKMIDHIHQAGLKAASLTQQLLAFSRKQVMEMKTTNLNIIVEDMAKMLARLIGEDIVLDTFLSPSCGNIMADPSQIGQILMNLIVNARDAMPQGGNITIETGSVNIDTNSTGTRQELKPGHYSLLSVTDSGIGMEPELREKVFEPFFTTKTVGKGTGLGLSMVYGIVKQHKGYIYVYSEPGFGTNFKVYFPIIEKDIDLQKQSKTVPLKGGEETILVVDDDESIRRLILDTLQPLGYTILPAASGMEALEKCDQGNIKIDMVLSDVIMPGMNGRQLIEAMRDLCPHVKAVLMSGYTENVIKQQGVKHSDYNLINKPLLPLSLARKIREILDEQPG